MRRPAVLITLFTALKGDDALSSLAYGRER